MTVKEPKIAVLLSTFNGARWLPECMRSLAEQTLPFSLIWRDDGSTDDSRGLVRTFGWKALHELSHSEQGQNIGACASFGLLAQAALETGADIFFFADQDDVWHRSKLERVASCFDTLDNFYPQLVHHDLAVVDELAQEIAPSLWRHMRLDPNQAALSRFLTRNSVTGCAMAVNRSLLQAAHPIPAAAIMHDWWLATVASAVGSIHAIPEALVKYRQHGENTLGAKGFFGGLNPFTNWVAGWRRGNDEYCALFPQARALNRLLSQRHDISASDKKAVDDFVALPALGVLRRCLTADRLDLRERGGLLWFVTMLRVALTAVPSADGLAANAGEP